MIALAFDLAWKSAVVTVLVLGAAALLRSRPASERVAVLRLGLAVLFALPLLAVLAPALQVQAPDFARFEPAPAVTQGPAPNATPAPGPVPGVAPIPGARLDAAPAPSAAPAALALPRIDPLTLLGQVWLAGVAFLVLRLLGGVAALALWTRQAHTVQDPAWRAALDRAAVGRRPRLKVSARIASPLSWSWPRGVILIDEATLSRPDRADAVLTHEMGHIRHHDWLFLMLSHTLVAVLWFNPFIWRLHRELTRQSEHAADAWAVRRISRTDYAGALVAMARSARPHVAMGMAGPSSDLARRVAAVLDASRGKGRPWSTAVVAVACVGIAGPLAALEWAPEALPAALRPAVAPAPSKAALNTAAAVVALLPDTLTAPTPTAPATGLSPDALAALMRQRDRGLAMFEAGARALEANAAFMRRQARIIPVEGRADMLREADNVDQQAQALRAQAREFAARDPATFTPMSEEEDRQMEIELQNLLAVPGQMEMAMQMPVDVSADVQVGFGSPLPMPLPLSREQMAAGLKEGAGNMRADAARLDAEAARLEQTPSPPEDIADQIGSLREQAADLRGQADDMDQQAADVLND